MSEATVKCDPGAARPDEMIRRAAATSSTASTGQPVPTALGDMPQLTGLSDQEAAARLQADGYNELPSAHGRSVVALIGEILLEPMILLLIGVTSAYLLLGDPRQAALLLGSILLIVGIELVQEHRTERALDRLRDLSSPRALVVRDGVLRRIPGREVVRGDTVILNEGDRVPADGMLVWATNVSVDESLLTGESLPVRKVVAAEAAGSPPGGTELECVYSGTLVTAGQGVAIVTAIGVGSEMGKIGRALHLIEPEEGALHRETARLVRRFAAIGMAVCVIVAIAYGVTRSDWLNGALAGLTLAIAMTPEEFPIVLTVFLVMGAWRMSRRRVLVRRLPAIETLGAATVLCVDKTGTITENRMSVDRLWIPTSAGLEANHRGNLPEDFHELIEFAVLASQRDPFEPMERAFARFADERLAETEHLHSDWTLVREYPLSPDLLALSRVWTSADATRYAVAAKGAPEAIADLCHLPNAEAEAAMQAVAAMATDGLRVLGVARAYFRHEDLPSQQHDFDFEFLGLVGLADRIRPEVPAAIQECHTAGLRVVMLTGDHPGTARHIAEAAGLRPNDTILSGPDLERMTDDELRVRVRSAAVFARVTPVHKLRLVQALQSVGEVVAMTGDGVNDAPALKAAHIGIAMGGRGTDVAREAAAMVLVDDDFASIVAAIRAGRHVYDNLKKAMRFVMAVHVPVAGVALVPILLGWPMILTAVHIVFLELLIDPACSIAFEAEPEEPALMQRPPRGFGEHLFTTSSVTLAVAQGMSVLIAVLAVLMASVWSGLADGDVRALSFAALVSGLLALIFVNRSGAFGIRRAFRASNVALWGIAAGTAVLLLLTLYVPPISELFLFAAPAPSSLALAVAAGAASVGWFDLLKTTRRWRPDAEPP